MTSPPPSPRRRHILASINPDEESTRRKHDSPDPEVQEPRDEAGDATSPRPSKIRFKSKHSRSHRSYRDRDRERDRDNETSSSHRRRHRRRRSRTPPNPYDPPPLDSDAAFRESLFDAMADDEGASYWENVYGQPAHVYSKEKVGPTGELERMTDEEYASHVRQKMWEKTHQGLLEERARREEQRARKETEEKLNRKLKEDMDRSLRRGEERRLKKMWIQRWEEYVQAWSGWTGAVENIPWPVETGRRGDVDEKEVRRFLVNGLGLEEVDEKAFSAKVKDERVRWHPDKIQQKLGGQVDDAIMKDVTAIFQIIDKLWADTRSKS